MLTIDPDRQWFSTYAGVIQEENGASGLYTLAHYIPGYVSRQSKLVAYYSNHHKAATYNPNNPHDVTWTRVHDIDVRTPPGIDKGILINQRTLNHGGSRISSLGDDAPDPYRPDHTISSMGMAWPGLGADEVMTICGNLNVSFNLPLHPLIDIQDLVIDMMGDKLPRHVGSITVAMSSPKITPGELVVAENPSNFHVYASILKYKHDLMSFSPDWTIDPDFVSHDLFGFMLSEYRQSAESQKLHIPPITGLSRFAKFGLWLSNPRDLYSGIPGAAQNYSFDINLVTEVNLCGINLPSVQKVGTYNTAESKGRQVFENGAWVYPATFDKIYVTLPISVDSQDVAIVLSTFTRRLAFPIINSIDPAHTSKSFIPNLTVFHNCKPEIKKVSIYRTSKGSHYQPNGPLSNPVGHFSVLGPGLLPGSYQP